jgi:hypothetical protein
MRLIRICLGIIVLFMEEIVYIFVPFLVLNDLVEAGHVLIKNPNTGLGLPPD